MSATQTTNHLLYSTFHIPLVIAHSTTFVYQGRLNEFMNPAKEVFD